MPAPLIVAAVGVAARAAAPHVGRALVGQAVKKGAGSALKYGLNKMDKTYYEGAADPEQRHQQMLNGQQFREYVAPPVSAPFQAHIATPHVPFSRMSS